MTYVLADIHGHYDKYKAMLEAIGLKFSDTLYVLGDAIDRGPDGVKVLLDMMGRPNVIPVMGNHEYTASVCIPFLLTEVTDELLDGLRKEQLAAYQEWMANGGGPTITALRRLNPDTWEYVLEYLQEMDLFAEVEAGGREFVLVHAGLENFQADKPLEDYELYDFLIGRPRLGAEFFPDRYLVYGHTPTRTLDEKGEDRILRRGRQIAMDCGCGFGGRLGCLCLETMEEFYV